MQDRRLVDEEQEFTGPEDVVQKLFNEVAPKFADRARRLHPHHQAAEYRIGDGGDAGASCSC